MNKTYCLLLCSTVAVILSGCNGIVRYKTLGFQESATVSLYDQSSVYLTPLTLPAGATADTGIFIADIAANPFCALWMVSQGPDPSAPFHPIAILLMPLYWCYTPLAMIILPFNHKEYYSSAYGREGHWLKGIFENKDNSKLDYTDAAYDFQDIPDEYKSKKTELDQ